MPSLFKLVGVLCITLLLTGCWDQVESEERGFVIGAAIDALEREEIEEADKEKVEDDGNFQEKNKFEVTYQVVVPSALQTKDGSSQTSTDAFTNITSVGTTMYKISRDMSKEISRSPYLEHIKMIIISEELAKKGYFSKILDIFLRDHEMRRATKVFISKGDARKPLEIRSKIDNLPVMYIDSISENDYKSGEMLPARSIGEIHGLLLGSESYTIPRITTIENKVNISGAAVFQGNNHKMIGTLNEKETKGLNFITGELKGGVLEFSFKGYPVAVEIIKEKRKIQADLSDKNNMDFTIDIKTEGNVGESFEGIDLLDPKIIRSIEEQAASVIKSLALEVIEKTQKDYEADVLGLASYLRQERYDTWKKIKKDWEQGENYFAKSNINVQVDVKIRSIGTNIETKK